MNIVDTSGWLEYLADSPLTAGKVFCEIRASRT